MELKDETGKLIETCEKWWYLASLLHKYVNLQWTKLSQPFFAVRLKDVSKFYEFENVSPPSFKSSYVIKRCVLTKWTPYVSARRRRWAWHSSKLPINLKVLQLLYGSPAVFDSEKLARNSAGCVNIEGRRWQMNFLDFVENLARGV